MLFRSIDYIPREFNRLGYDASAMFQDRKVDENGEIMILPKDSDK